MTHHTLSSSARLFGAGLRALLVLTLVCGVLYPLAVTGVAQTVFPDRANGSPVRDEHGRVAGSSLIGQTYQLPKRNPDDAAEAAKPDLRWFQPRPSHGLGSNKVSGVNTRYSLLLSGATNRSGDNPELIRWVTEAKAAVIRDNSVPGHPVRPADVPADAVTSSGSGLDPHISPAYARLQAHRVAQRHGLAARQVRQLVAEHTRGRTLGFLGEPRVSVLELNIALRALAERG